MDPKKQYYENTAATVIKNMEKRHIKGYYCPDSKSAVQMLLELIPQGSSIGWGGAETLKETGIMDAICGGPYRIFDRKSVSTPEETRKIYQEINACDYFLMSSNAITLAGELINIDGRGNRVSSLCFGPEHVIIVAGMNKVVANLESGLDRVHNVAAPINALRLNKNTPCAVTGKCADCQSPDCICTHTVITRNSHTPGRIQVILVGEELGY